MKHTTEETAPEISISVVSHAQIHLIKHLLQDIHQYCGKSFIEIILTLNLNEHVPFITENFAFPVKIIRNPHPLGFATNHNQAFANSSGNFFCVMNPDIRLSGNPFSALLECLKNSSIALAAPLVLGPNGEIEDSARRFPTPLKILCKAVGGCKGNDYPINIDQVFPDWVGGMFMLFPRSIYKLSGGFNEQYFLYYEDVDLCARLKLKGYKIALCPKARVIHFAHRSSRHNFRYLKWHLTSMMRFFSSPVFIKIFWLSLKRNK
uniref:Glycosyltransferase 2-like domain-containing protein n=1 Tax=Candidatus Nitrotoga fabula TaxID=2182327 RepID=A0A2X0QXS6_9PROT|nr:conserved protein of unknown function [Candidatus Nitrotoga fabula]